MMQSEIHMLLRKANDPDTTLAELEQLATHTEPLIRAAVAQNTRTSKIIRNSLANDIDETVRQCSAFWSRNDFPTIVKVNKITGENLVLTNATEDDAEFIIEMRTNIKKSKHISPTKNDIKAQQQWMKDYNGSSDQAYFIIRNLEGVRFGTIRIYDARKYSFCWGSWIISDDAPKITGIESALIIHYYGLRLGFRESRCSIRRENTRVCSFVERIDAQKVKEGKTRSYYELHAESLFIFLQRYKKFLPNGIAIPPR